MKIRHVILTLLALALAPLHAADTPIHNAKLTGNLTLAIDNPEAVRDALDLGSASNVSFDEVRAGSLIFSNSGFDLTITGAVGSPENMGLNFSVQATSTILIGANLEVYSLSKLNQDLQTTAFPTHIGLRLTPSTTTSTLNFASNQVQTITLSGDTTFTTSNLAAGRSKTVIITCDGTARTLTFPAWVFVGAAAPVNIAASKKAVLTITATSTTNESCIAEWFVQDAILPVSSGGTGASTAAAARTALGLGGPRFEATKTSDQLHNFYSTNNAVTFTSEITDTDNAFASSAFTVPTGKGGLYEIVLTVFIDDIAGVPGAGNGLFLRVGGTRKAAIGLGSYGNGTQTAILVIQLAAGDVLDVVSDCNSGSGHTIKGATALATRFAGRRLSD